MKTFFPLPTWYYHSNIESSSTNEDLLTEELELIPCSESLHGNLLSVIYIITTSKLQYNINDQLDAVHCTSLSYFEKIIQLADDQDSVFKQQLMETTYCY